tara:strand:+ start:83 stop:514 length:432 start_codon:yes stop_codon:yes gene_type:complete
VSSPKPTLGYPTRTDAVLALVEQGFDNRAIAQKVGISTSTVSGLIASSRRAKARGGYSASPQRGRYGMPFSQLETLVMDLYEEGLSRDQIAERLNIRRETADKIIGYMRIGQTDLAFGHDAAARSSRLLVAALKRHHPGRCGQ